MYKLWFAVEEIDETDDHYEERDLPTPVGPIPDRKEAMRLLNIVGRSAGSILPGDLARFADCDYETPFQGHKVHLAVEQIENEGTDEESYETVTEITVAVLGPEDENRAFELVYFLAGYAQRLIDAQAQ